jgi:molybdopterin-containing oxidoreductase family membrane subunit
LPSSWGNFSPTIIDICIYAGSLGLFFTLFLLFIRWIPMIAMAEVKGVLPDSQPHHHEDEDEHAVAHGAPVVAE